MSRIGAVLTGDRRDLGDGPPVTAMLVQNTNPAAVAPESGRVRAGLLRDDLFLCVHEQFMTDTARYADIVLPATTFLEHDDLYKGGGHMYLQVARALIPPQGEARENHVVVRELAARLGAEHAGFDMNAWELVDATLQPAVRAGALPRRLRPCRRPFPLQPRLGCARPRSRRAARASRPRRHHRRT
jgi:anaerobic selenocysteine-containing dehydrogenase